jgi:hypothetical protein
MRTLNFFLNRSDGLGNTADLFFLMHPSQRRISSPNLQYPEQSALHKTQVRLYRFNNFNWTVDSAFIARIKLQSRHYFAISMLFLLCPPGSEHIRINHHEELEGYI